MEATLECFFLHFDDDGWRDTSKKFLNFEGVNAYKGVKGMHFNIEDGTYSFLLEPAQKPEEGLISMDDI